MPTFSLAILALVAHAGAPAAGGDRAPAGAQTTASAQPVCPAPGGQPAPREKPELVQGVVVLPPAMRAAPGGGPIVIDVPATAEAAVPEAKPAKDVAPTPKDVAPTAEASAGDRGGAFGGDLVSGSEALQPGSAGAEMVTRASAASDPAASPQARDAAGRTVQVIRDGSGGLIEIVRDADGSLVSARGVGDGQ